MSSIISHETKRSCMRYDHLAHPASCAAQPQSSRPSVPTYRQDLSQGSLALTQGANVLQEEGPCQGCTPCPWSWVKAVKSCCQQGRCHVSHQESVQPHGWQMLFSELRVVLTTCSQRTYMLKLAGVLAIRSTRLLIALHSTWARLCATPMTDPASL